ncbi:MAG: GLPGLI family protein [Thermonemataceae bacterium]|nr:GLPGLI family protein [Thermonemataceae bacterium]
MRKTFIFLLIFLTVFLANSVFSQNFLVEYKFDFKADEPIYNYQLLFNDSLSIWRNLGDVEKESKLWDVDAKKDYFIYKKNASQKLYDHCSLSGKIFHYEDKLNLFRWKLISKTKTIMNFKCNAATTEFRGRTYTAYYTTEIPISNGPWKFGGLSGLILEVSSDDGKYTYSAVKIIKNVKFKINNNLELGNTYLQWEDYKKEFISFHKRRAKQQKAKYGGGMSFKFRVETMEIKVEIEE